jgi:MoaA/NifB/PqqE/SkfB family radical SAM enzyme
MASIVIELTNKCNFKCIFCEATKMRTHASLDYNIALELLDIAKNENIHGILL